MSAVPPSPEKSDTLRIPRIEMMAALAVGLLALAVYLRTLHPGVGPSLDSIELQIAALVRGLIHPPGSPQYLWLGGLLMRLPLGLNAAFRLNLLSAFAGAGTVALAHLLTYRMTRNTAVSVFAALSLALAVRLWYQSSISELYALNALYLLGSFYLLVAWNQSGRPVFYWAAVSVYALGFGNHLSMILLLPAFLLIVRNTNKSQMFEPRNLALTLLIVALGAAQYLLIPLRTGAAFCNFCPAGTGLGGLIDYITGGPFKGAMLSVGPRALSERLPESMAQLAIQFQPWGIVLGVMGGWEWIKRRPLLGWPHLIALLCAYGFVLTYDIPDWHDFMTPVYILFAPLIGFGLLRIWEKIEPQVDEWLIRGRFWAARAYPVGLSLLAGATLLFAFWAGLPRVDQRDAPDLALQAETLLAAMPAEAIFLMPHPASPSFIYSWAVKYALFESGRAGQVVIVTPPEVDPAPGPGPYYRRWADIAAEITPQALSESGLTIFSVDWADDRLADIGLLPICTDEGVIAGYQAAAVRLDGEIHPLVDAATWERIALSVAFDGEGIACPGD